LADGTAEALKWLALALMVLDHANKYLCNDALPWVFPIARLSFPLFGFVLAYNLARPDTISNGAAVRVMKRLALFALVAAIPHIILDGRFFPLNILATLLVATGTVYLFEQGGLKRWHGILVFRGPSSSGTVKALRLLSSDFNCDCNSPYLPWKAY